MMNLDEAIQHCKEKAKELRTEAEQLRDIGEVISSPKQLYNEPVKNCLNCSEEHEQLAEWLMELKKLREENINQFLNSKDIILALIEENKALREQRPQGEWISKEEALKIMCEKCPVYNCVLGCNSYRSIEKMSSVQSQRPTGDLADEVWKLYEKHQSHLATHVLEFGDELKELLGKYQKGDAE